MNTTIPAAPGRLIPARPTPPKSYPGILPTLLGARRDLLSIWWEGAYRSDTMDISILGRKILVANSPETVRHVLLTNNDNFQRKSPQMRRALELLIGDSLFITDGAHWRMRRNAVAPIIHRNRLAQFAPIMADVAARRAERWESLAGSGPVDALTEMASLTAEIISRSVFGWDLPGEAAERIIRGFTGYQARIDPLNVGYFLGADAGWPQLRRLRLGRASRLVRDTVAELVAEHEKGLGDRRSVVAQLLEAKVELTPEAITNEAVMIFMAGHETTAATLAWTWYLLSQAPWAESRLHAEIDEVLGGQVPTLEDVTKLVYTRAVIEEALRLYPPVPVLSRQAIADDVVGGVPVPAGSLVLIIPWLLHRHRKYWRRPNHFNPNRFTHASPPTFAYIPFAAGPRVCAGAGFALTEAILCLATLAGRYRLRLPDGARVSPTCRLTLRPAGGMPMHIERRQ